MNTIQHIIYKLGLKVGLAQPLEKKEREQIEDILKALYHAEQSGKPIDVNALCIMAQVDKQELPNILHKMEELNLTNKEYKLTDKGRKEALTILRRHRLYETYLSRHSGYGPEQWHKMAHEKEHSMNSDEWDKINTLLGNPLFDPHGDPIPTALSLTLPEKKAESIDFKEGLWIYVSHVEDDDEDKYRTLVELGLGKGSVFLIEKMDAIYLEIFVEGKRVALPQELLNYMDVRPANQDEIERYGGKEIHKLTELKDDEEATIQTISPLCQGAARRRLMDLGFVFGSNIIIDVKSPMGNPTAYLVRGSAIALREDQAQYILIKDIRKIGNK